MAPKEDSLVSNLREGTRYVSNSEMQNTFFTQRALLLAVAQLAAFDVNNSRADFFPASQAKPSTSMQEGAQDTVNVSASDTGQVPEENFQAQVKKVEDSRWRQWRNLLVHSKILALAVLERVVHSSSLNQQLVGDLRLPITKQFDAEEWVLSALVKMECFPPSLTSSVGIMGEQDGAAGRVCMIDGPLGMENHSVESLNENEAVKDAAGRVLDVFLKTTEVGKLIVIGHTITPPPTESWEKVSDSAGRVLADKFLALTESCISVGASSQAKSVSRTFLIGSGAFHMPACL